MVQVLDGLKSQKFDNVLVGMDLLDDAGVVKVSDDRAVVTTVDYFTPVVDNPFDFGAIAAANSLSDVYAMGARPLSALNIVGFPEEELPLSVLKEIIDGALTVTREAGIPVVGGHTVKSPEPFFGLAITGEVHPDKILTNSSARSGDHLYLTKPLGSGLITTSLKNDKTTAEIVSGAVAIMKELNRPASEAILAVIESGADCAVTDITGYGLLGHLLEILLASDKSAILDFGSIPLMPGVMELAAMDQFPGGSRSNLLGAEPVTLWDGRFEKYEKLILADAQTSGGLLISIGPELSGKLESEMDKRKVKYARIGEIVDQYGWRIKVTKK